MALTLAGIAYSTYIAYLTYRQKSYIDDLDSRMKSTEEDMSTLRGQIGVLLGNKHPGGMRTPDNTERYRDKLEASENNKFQASLAGLFLAPAAAKRKAAVKKKKISQKLNPPRPGPVQPTDDIYVQQVKPDPPGATEHRPIIRSSRR